MAHCKSLIGRKDFFWHGDLKTGRWNLTRQLFTKKGKPAKQCYDEKLVSGAFDLDDPDVKAHFVQIETDLVFELANGTAPSQRPLKSLLEEK